MCINEQALEVLLKILVIVFYAVICLLNEVVENGKPQERALHVIGKVVRAARIGTAFCLCPRNFLTDLCVELIASTTLCNGSNRRLLLWRDEEFTICIIRNLEVVRYTTLDSTFLFVDIVVRATESEFDFVS